MSAPVARRDTSAGNPQTRPRSMHLGLAAYRRRKALGITQEQLADTLGWDRTAVSRIENAAFSPSLHRLFLLADALGVHLDELLTDARKGGTA